MRILFFFSILVFQFITGFAQNSGIRDTSAIYDEKMRPALVVNLEADDIKQFKKYVKSYFKDKYKLKFETPKQYFVAREIVIQDISSKEIDCIIEAKPRNTTEMSFLIFMRFGYDFYINESEYPNEYSAFRNLVRLFGKNYLTDFYKEKLEMHTKALEKAKKEKSKLLKINRKLTKTTQRNDKKIYKLQKKDGSTPEKLQKIQTKVATLSTTNATNRETLANNDERVAVLQQEILKHSTEISQIQEKINRIQ